MDEFGPLNLQPHPGKQWAPVAAGKGDAEPAAAAAAAGDVHPAARGPAPDGRLRPVHRSALRAHRQARRTAPSSSRSAATCGRCTHPRCGSRSCSTTSARTCPPRTTSASASGRRRTTSSSPTSPFYASWLNRIEAQFTALRYFALDGTDHPYPPRPGPHDPPLHRLAEPQRPRPSTT